MGTFSEYYEKLKADNDDRLSKAYYQILSSVSKADSKTVNPYGDSISIQIIINEMLKYFGYDKLTFPLDCLTIEEHLDYVAFKSNIFKRKVILRDNWRLETTSPLLCKLTKTDEYIMLIPNDFGGYRYIDPVSLNMEVLTEDKSKEISLEAYCFYRPLPSDSLKLIDLCKFVIQCVSVKELINLVFISFFVLLINLFIPMLNRILFDVVIPSGTSSDILPIAGLLSGVVLASISFNVLKEFNFSRTSNKVRVYLQGAVWSRMFSLPASFFKQNSSSNVYQQTEAINRIGEILSGSAVSTVLTCMLSFIYIFQIANFVPELVLPTIFISLLIMSFSVFLSVLSVKYQKSQIILSSKLDSFVFEVLSGIAKIKIAGAQIRVFTKWAEKYSDLTNITYSPSIFIIMSNALYRTLTLGASVYIYFVAAKHNVAPADFIGFTVAFAAFSFMLMQFQDIVVQIANLSTSYSIAKPLLETEPECLQNLRKAEKLEGGIEISNISFKYSDDGPLVLNEINIRIKPGEYVAIVGTSGCGKSTLLRILLGFEKPSSGTVYYDNQDMHGLDLGSIRRQIGVVMQNDTLFADSIYANIAICNPSITVEEAFAVATKAGLEDDINNMPMGMYTMIGENAAGISGGQRQRLMIARAFASNPSIIMFDEATSALDNISQQKIITSLEEFKATKIVIAHRLSTVIKCDRIIVLDKGSVVESGKYQELLDKKGLFYEMAKRQLVSTTHTVKTEP